MREKPASPAEAIASVFAWIGISAVTVFWVIPIAVVFLFRRFLDPDLRLAHHFATRWGRNLIGLAPGSSVQVFGEENIPADRPAILMANHLSYVDVPLLCFIRHQFKWMADVGLFSIPFFGWAMRMAGYIPVDRGNPRAGLRSLEQAKFWLSKGISIFIFPEGTRSQTGVFSKFQTGGFRLAVTAGVPVVPVVVIGTRQLLPRNSWIFRWGIKLQIRILEPVLPDSSDPKQVRALSARVRSSMFRAYQQHLGEIRAS